MKILLLGGTGAIGEQLSSILIKNGHEVFVTTRSIRSHNNRVNYIAGNAKDPQFLKEISSNRYDALVDFMVYSTKEFQERHETLLRMSSHYVYLSSARVFADSLHPISESSLRILDSTKDAAYLETDEYALAKARQENLLRGNIARNWTIVRPYISYGDTRLQLAVMEKEEWLSRAIDGKKIIFCHELENKTTTLTSGADVAMLIQKILMLSSDVHAEEFNLVSQNSIKWSDVIHLYSDVMNSVVGHPIRIMHVSVDDFISVQKNRYQVIYDRLYDRIFDNSKVRNLMKDENFSDPNSSLAEYLRKFLRNPYFLELNPEQEAKKDVITKEFAKLNRFPTFRKKLKYIYHRLH